MGSDEVSSGFLSVPTPTPAADPSGLWKLLQCVMCTQGLPLATPGSTGFLNLMPMLRGLTLGDFSALCVFLPPAHPFM